MKEQPVGQKGTESEAPRYAFAHLRHELRTPLNQIIGFSDILLEDAEARGEEAAIKDLRRIHDAGHRVLQMINDILDVSQMSAGRIPSSPPESILTFTSVEAPVAMPLDAGEPPIILVVDDDGINRDLLSRRLERYGCATRGAEGGREALHLLEKEPVDLILLDIMMPKMNGFEVLSALKADEHLRHIPVIVISALDDLDSVVRGIAMGAEDYLPKPFNPILLRARIEASLERKRLRDREQDLYHELEANYTRLKELERLRDDLTHMIVHDLRQPMTGFLTGLRMMEVMGPLTPEQVECMNVAVMGGETLIDMVNDLLDIKKMEAGAMVLEKKTIDLAHLFDQAEKQVRWLVKESCLQLNREPAPDTSVNGDESLLRRVLVNLLGNATKFTPAGGTITLGSHRDNGEVVLTVRDTGHGIPADAFGRIFEKFGQVDMRKEGRMVSTGLGLTFCKMVAEAHGGRIWVDSQPEQGSLFSVALPAAQ